jgi:hypothetical protein
LVIYAALKSAPVPLAHRPLMEMVTAAQDPRYNVVEGIGHVSKTKIRGVFSLLKTSGCFQLTNEGPEEFVFLSLGQGLNSFKDFKERHDDYIRQCWRHMQFLPPERIRGHVVWELDEQTLRKRLMEFKQLFERIETFYRRDFPLLELSENKVGNNNSNNNNNYSAVNNNVGRRQQPQQQSRGNYSHSHSHHQTNSTGGSYSSYSSFSSAPFSQEQQPQQRGRGQNYHHQQLNNDSLLSSSSYSRGIGNDSFPPDSTSSPGSSFFSASLPLPVSSAATSTNQNSRQSPSLFNNDHADYDYYSSENYSEQTQQPQQYLENNINNNNNIISNGFPFQAGNPSSASSASSASFFSSSLPSASFPSKLVLSDSLSFDHFAATDADAAVAASQTIENYATGNNNDNDNINSYNNDYFQFNNERGNL